MVVVLVMVYSPDPKQRSTSKIGFVLIFFSQTDERNTHLNTCDPELRRGPGRHSCTSSFVDLPSSRAEMIKSELLYHIR